MTRSSKSSVKTSILSRDVDTLRRLAATKCTFHHFQQVYGFYNDVYVDGRYFHKLPCKAVSTSDTFVFIMMLYPIASCLQPILSHVTIALNVLSLMHLVPFHLDISAGMHLLHGNEIV
ncbi:hypothetical protein TNCV_2092081 [Trichonephila clavipes]|nr:hypothetical protein TNCV_2092081 [Trichonephila clavipes]